MDEVKEEPAKPTLEELLKHSKIVTVHKECTRPKQDNLKMILGAVDGTKFQNNTPVAIVATIGPEKSGKSFLTNFLIQYLKQGGEGGWMSSVMTQKGFLEGFSFGSVSSEKFYEPDPKDGESSGSLSGVYLWPEPFEMTKTGIEGGKLLVWVLHVHSVQGESQGNLAALERFLMLTCSRIMEIKWKNDEEFRILEHIQFLSGYDPTLRKQICDSIVYTFRSGKKISADTDDEAKETLEELLQETGKCETSYLSSLSNCKHVNITLMNDCPQPLHDQHGVFSAKMKTFQKPIRIIVDKMLEESEIEQKWDGEHPLTLGTMLQFVEAAANKVLASDPASSTSQKNLDLKPANDNHICQTAKLTHTGPMETGATATTGKLTNGNVTSPVTQNDQNKSDVERSTTTTLRSLLEIGDENTPSPLTRSREKRELFLSELIEPLARRNAKVEGANEISLSLADNEEELKNFRVVKDQNQNSTKVVKHVLHQSTHVAPLSPAVVAPKLYSISEQKVEELSNLVSQMKVDDTIENKVPEATIVLETEENGRNSTQPMDVDDDGPVIQAVENLQIVKSNEFKKKQQKENMDAQNFERERKREEAEKKPDEENLRKKQERERMEEEDRSQEEEARSVMMECLDTAVSQIQQTLSSNIKFWMDHRFSVSTLNQIETIYAQTFKDTTKEYTKIINAKLWKEFILLLDGRCKERCIPVLRSISEPVVQLNQAVKRQFNFHGYFNSPKLEKMFSEEFQKLKIPQENEFIAGMIKRATDKLTTIYQKHNDIIITEEKNNFMLATSQIENLYHEQMKRYMEYAPYSPQKLDTIHRKLVDKLLTAFKKAFHLSNTVNSFITSIEEPLKESLAKGYKSYENSNDTKLKKLQSEINKIVLKSKTKYTEDIEAVLKQYPDGVELRVLNKHNDSIQLEAMKLLEMEIRPKRADEPVGIHQKVLQNHIDSYWPAVLKANKSNMEKKKERDEEDQRQQKKAEAQRKLEEQNIAADGRKSSTSCTASTQPQHQLSNSSRKSWTHIDGKEDLTTPLVFHLQSSRIVMAMDINGHPTVLENESGEMQTPAWVAFTPENKFVYGSEALALADQDPSDSENDILIWSVAEFFLNSNCLFYNERIWINGTEHVITTEFLLAVLLNNLKETIEHRMGSQCTTTVIAIPFSFSSPQRIQVKAAAKIAGFSEVYLINEASAAAYNFVLSDKRVDSVAEVLVLSENIDRVDAFVYSYHTFEKKLKMMGHAGNEDESRRKKSWSLRKIAKGFLNYVISYGSSNEDNSKHDDSTSRTIRNACKHAIAEASSGKSKVETKETLYICENFSRWSDMLSNVTKDFGRKACDINQENAVVSGAVILARNPKEIGRFIRDKLAYDVLRPALFSGCKVVSSRKEQLPENLKKQNLTLHTAVNSTSFYQEVYGVNHEIGQLSINIQLSYDQYIEPSLDITNEGIVKFRSATMDSSRSNLRSRVSYSVPEEAITWLTPNLSEEALAVLTSLLSSITVPREDPALAQAKAQVREKCQEMEEKIAGDKFKMKSDLAKEMVTQKIKEAKQFASHAKATLDDISKQMDNLQRLCDKYEKK